VNEEKRRRGKKKRRQRVLGRGGWRLSNQIIKEGKTRTRVSHKKEEEREPTFNLESRACIHGPGRQAPLEEPVIKATHALTRSSLFPRIFFLALVSEEVGCENTYFSVH
jgi:hypothetical protein